MIEIDEVQKEILEVIPWPYFGIKYYKSIDFAPWGYLTIYTDTSFKFDEFPSPPRDEIEKRWGYVFSRNQLTPDAN